MEEKEETKTVAYVYKWTHLSTLKWYLGSRTAKGCHPEDGYICSSKIVKPLIQNNPQDWVRTIIEIGEPAEMRKLEAGILTMFDAKNDPRSFNMHNGDGKFSTLGKEAHNKGKPHSPETRAKISAAKKGKPLSPEHIAKLEGKKHSLEVRSKMSEVRKGRKQSPEHTAKLTAAKAGKKRGPPSPEHRAKIAAANKGKKHSQEHRAKNAAAKIKVIIATNLNTGEVFEIRGGHLEMKALGFCRRHVSACARGVYKSHKGHSFRFKDE